MADREPQKLIELSGDVWMEGISLHPYLAIGGIFQEATNFDPFEKMGIYIPSLAETRDGAATVTIPCAYNVGFQSGGTSYFYALGNNGLYQIATSLKTVTDRSAQITGITTARGAAKFKGRFLYANDSLVKSQVIPVDGSETTILSGLQTAEHSMHIGPDRNCYITNKQYIGKITSATSSTGNVAQYLSFEDDVTTRDLTDDGKHLVIIADRNESSGGDLSSNGCFVGFWNMKSQDLTAYHETQDDRFYWGERIEDDILVMGRNNIYICNVSTPLRILMPTRGNSTMTTATGGGGPGSVVRKGNGIILWAAGTGTVFGYGRPHPSLKRIFFKPYSIASGSIGSLYFDSSKLWAFDNTASPGAKLYDFGSGSTRQSSILTMAEVNFKKTYEFAFARIVLREAMSSVQTVLFDINTLGDNKTITDDNSFNNTDDPSAYSKVFYPKTLGDTNDASVFKDLTGIRLSNTKAEVRSLEIWGYPVDSSQDLAL